MNNRNLGNFVHTGTWNNYVYREIEQKNQQLQKENKQLQKENQQLQNDKDKLLEEIEQLRKQNSEAQIIKNENTWLNTKNNRLKNKLDMLKSKFRSDDRKRISQIINLEKKIHNLKCNIGYLEENQNAFNNSGAQQNINIRTNDKEEDKKIDEIKKDEEISTNSQLNNININSQPYDLSDVEFEYSLQPKRPNNSSAKRRNYRWNKNINKK